MPDAKEVIEIEVDQSKKSPEPEQLVPHAPMETPHSTPAYPQEGAQSQLSQDELTQKLSDVYTKEEAERIAREAVEHGTLESQQIISEREMYEEGPPGGDEEYPAEPPKLDYSRVMQEEFGRSESVGTDLDRDREFTRDDFGEDVPDELQRPGSTESEKPTVEVFSESGAPIAELPAETTETHVHISKSPDDELADYQVIEKEDIGEEIVGSGGLSIEEPTVRPHSPIPPRWQSAGAEQGWFLRRI